MWTALSNGDYTARHIGIRMQFFYKKELQCELEIRTQAQARAMLNDWARLQIPPAQVKVYQELVTGYVGARIDDVTVGEDGTFFINGKSIEVI